MTGRDNYASILFNTGRTDDQLYVSEIGHAQSPAGYFTTSHVRNAYILHYVVRGKGGFCGKPVRANQGMLICPECSHEFRADEEDPWERYWIIWGGSKAGSLLSGCGLTAENHIFDYHWGDEIFPIFQNALKASDKIRNSQYYLIGILYLLLSFHERYAARDASGRENPVSRAVWYMNTQYSSGITMEQTAAYAGVSEHYLCHLFQERMRISPQQYLLRVRLDRALELLARSDLRINEISRSVGYSDALYFSKLFRKKMNMSPTEYRQGIRNNKEKS